MNQELIADYGAVIQDAVDTGLFTRYATFYDRTGGANAMGQVNQTPVAVAGLENINCMFSVARLSPVFLPDEGARTQQGFIEEPEYHLLLNDYYPAVLARYTVQLDGDASVYEITPGTVQGDSQKSMTRCKLRRYSF